MIHLQNSMPHLMRCLQTGITLRHMAVVTDGTGRLPWEASLISKIIEVRKAQGLSQTDLAKRLADLGLPFYQPTVARIEAGERPIRLNEAIAFCEVLGLDLSDAIHSDTAEYRQGALAALYRPAVDAYGELLIAARKLIILRDRYQFLSQAAERAGDKLDGEVAAIGLLTPIEGLRAVATAADLADSETAQMTLRKIGKLDDEHPEAS